MFNTETQEIDLELNGQDFQYGQLIELMEINDTLSMAVEEGLTTDNLVNMANTSIKRANVLIGIPGYFAEAQRDLDEVSCEGFRDKAVEMGRGAYRAIAKLLSAFLGLIRRLFAYFTKSNDESERVRAKAEEHFWAMAEKSDSIIKELSLAPGQKITPAELKDIEAFDGTVMTDGNDLIVTTEMIKLDVTRMIPKPLRQRSNLGIILGKRGLGELSNYVTRDIEGISKVATIGQNTHFEEYGNRLVFGKADVETVEWLVNDAETYCADYVTRAYESAGLKPILRSATPTLAFSLSSEVFHFMLRTAKNGRVPYLEGDTTSNPKLWGKSIDLNNQTYPKVKKWEKVPFSEYQMLLTKRSEVATLLSTFEEYASRQNVLLEKISGNNGVVLEEAKERLKSIELTKAYEGHREQLIKDLTSYGRSARMQSNLYARLAKMSADYVSILDNFLLACIAKAADDLAAKEKAGKK